MTADEDDTDDEDDASETGRLTGSLGKDNVSDKGAIQSPKGTGEGVEGSTPFKEPVMNQKQKLSRGYRLLNPSHDVGR